jgi:hypothetical protein
MKYSPIFGENIAPRRRTPKRAKYPVVYAKMGSPVFENEVPKDRLKVGGVTPEI